MKLRIVTSSFAIALVCAVGGARDAHAQQIVVERRPVTLTEPNVALTDTGIVTLALSYGVAAITGGASTYDKDRLLFIPIVGPWIDLANRPAGDCHCGDEAAARIGLVVDGIFQAIGAIELIAGMLWHYQHQEHQKRVTSRPAVSAMFSGAGVSGTF
jgi:hypothetical protein